MQLSEDDIEEVDALYMQNLRGIAELSGGEITTDNFHEVPYIPRLFRSRSHLNMTTNFGISHILSPLFCQATSLLWSFLPEW